MYNSQYCHLEHLEGKNTILCQWKEFCIGEDYRNPFKFAMNEIEKLQISTWITDTTHGFKSIEADTEWLLEEFVPNMINSSIEKIVFIISDDSPLMEEIKEQEVALSKYFKVELVESLESKL